MRQFLDEL